MKTTKIAIASDHAGFNLKKVLVREIEKMGLDLIDLGTYDESSVDYPDYAKLVVKEIEENNVDFGVLVCGSGIGMSIAANRNKSIRAALIYNSEVAKYSRLHNDANILVLGSRFIDEQTAIDCLKVFLETEFEKGRHLKRIEKF